MATIKPTKPTNLMPRHFADDGIKNNFSSAKIASGFSSNFEDILQGDNLNYMLDSIGKELQYLSSVVDFIVDMPINKTFKVNANNNLEYTDIVSDASSKANISLDNLNSTGQAKLDNKANIDLNNLSATGNAKLDNKANINLSNLTTTGMSKIQPIGQPQLTLDFGTLPSNCIWLEGATVSRTTYANLFAIYGTTYGAGDGSTTFTLPDFRNRALWGGSYGGYLSAGLPNIEGNIYKISETWSAAGIADGAFTKLQGYNAGRTPTEHDSGSTGGITFNANNSNTIYGNSNTVQPPSIKVRVYTRYQ